MENKYADTSDTGTPSLDLSEELFSNLGHREPRAPLQNASERLYPSLAFNLSSTSSSTDFGLTNLFDSQSTSLNSNSLREKNCPNFATLTPGDTWERESNRELFYKQKRLWDLGETIGGIYSGAVTAKRFAGKLAPLEKEPKSLPIAAARMKGVGAAFSSVLCASAIDFGCDQVLAPNEQKMESTAIADWFVAPAISIASIRWPIKLGAIVGVHMVGRLIDHFRQPKQNF
jgi:hypothetical protein